MRDTISQIYFGDSLMRDGWEPRCEFLGADVPDAELPHVKDTETFKTGIMGGAVGSLEAWWERERPAA